MPAYVPPQLDSDVVRTFLSRRLNASVTSVERLSTGNWTAAYAVDTATDRLIARFGAYGDDFERDRFAIRFTSPAIPVPEILEIGTFEQWAFAISRRATGSFLDHQSEADMHATLPSLFETWHALAGIDLSSMRGFGGVDVHGNAPFATMREFLLDVGEETDDPRNGGWREAMSRMPGGPAIFDECFTALVGLVDSVPDERHVAHSDFLNFNVLVHDHRISALLDWGCMQYADALYDVALFSLYQPWYPAWTQIRFAVEYRSWLANRGIVYDRFDDRLRACVLHIGLGNLRYNALQQRHSTFVETAERLLQFARGTV